MTPSKVETESNSLIPMHLHKYMYVDKMIKIIFFNEFKLIARDIALMISNKINKYKIALRHNDLGLSINIDNNSSSSDNNNNTYKNNNKPSTTMTWARIITATSTSHPLCNVAGSRVPVSQTIKTLDITFDSHLTFNAHIQSLTKACYFHIRALRHIRSCITLETAK